MLFDPKSFEAPVEVIETYDGDFPKRLVLPTQEREIDVSPGGIIITQDIQDAFLLAHDGITAVEFQPELTPEFSESALAMEEDFYKRCLDLYELRREDDDFTKNQFLQLIRAKGWGGSVLSDPKFSPIIESLTDHISFSVLFLTAFREWHGYDDEPCSNFTRPSPGGAQFFHFDQGGYARALFNALGKTTWSIDERISVENARKLLSNFNPEKDEARKFLAFNKNIRRSAQGSVSFVAGTAVIGETYEIRGSDLVSKEDVIKNVSVHTAPLDLEYKEPRLFHMIS